MKTCKTFKITREKAIGLAAALLLHTVVLSLLWHYRIIPPPIDTLTVFVKYINPAAPARILPPAPPKPVPTPPQPVARSVTPVTPAAQQLITSTAPVTSPVEPVAPPPPVKTPAPARVASPVAPVTSAVSATTPPRLVALGNELSVNCSERTPPVYPKQSVRLGEHGKTVLQVELNEAGNVISAVVKSSSGFSRLDEAAIIAVKSWSCTPAKRNGVAVRSTALQPFNFTLKGR